jgi:hypothetical protein
MENPPYVIFNQNKISAINKLYEAILVLCGKEDVCLFSLLTFSPPANVILLPNLSFSLSSNENTTANRK